MKFVESIQKIFILVKRIDIYDEEILKHANKISTDMKQTMISQKIKVPVGADFSW